MTRDVVQNPVRAGMVDVPEEWVWSSHRAVIGEAPPRGWLALDGLLSHFGPSREEACFRYRRFVHEGVGETLWQGLRQRR